MMTPLRGVFSCFATLLLLSVGVVEAVSVNRFLGPVMEAGSGNFTTSSLGKRINRTSSVVASGAQCQNGYSEPVTPLYIKGGHLEEESGLASSRTQDILWIHNDNYDIKRIYGISLSGRNAGHVVYIMDLEDLPGINKYSDFEDLAVAMCPFQGDVEQEEREWCLWVGDVGNNAEWGKGTFLYVFPEPILSEAVHSEPIDTTVHVPKQATTFRLNYEDYEYFKGPNIEALTVADDGSKFWLFQKTLSKDGDGPAAVWESPSLLQRGSGSADICERDSNDTWYCSLGDRGDRILVSHRYTGAELQFAQMKPTLSVRSNPAPATESLTLPLEVRKLGYLTNPLPSCETCGNKMALKNIRNIAAADLSRDGKSLLLATYGGVFVYNLQSPFDMSSILDGTPGASSGKMVTTTNRDGTAMTGNGKFWSGQEGIAFDYSHPSSDQFGLGIWSVSEHHKKLYYLKCIT